MSKTQEPQKRLEDGRYLWRITFHQKDLAALVLPADTRNEAYKAAAIMAPYAMIKRVSEVLESER